MSPSDRDAVLEPWKPSPETATPAAKIGRPIPNSEVASIHLQLCSYQPIYIRPITNEYMPRETLRLSIVLDAINLGAEAERLRN
jgi:hypothetical protein